MLPILPWDGSLLQSLLLCLVAISVDPGEEVAPDHVCLRSSCTCLLALAAGAPSVDVFILVRVDRPVRIGRTRSMRFSGHVLNTFSPVFGHLPLCIKCGVARAWGVHVSCNGAYMFYSISSILN